MLTESKVLIVDDNQDVVELLSINLEHEGFSVTTASNGQEALKKIHSEKPGVVILDVMLPEIDGVKVLKTIKENPDTTMIPVIMLTAKCQLSDKLSSLRYGADDFVGKPFNIEELILKVKNILTRSEATLSANPLTTLPGSPAIRREVSELLHSGRSFAFAYLDMDNFKPYNDVYGYAKGDELIKCVAAIIHGAIDRHGTKNDFIGHIGGDDFVFITDPDKIDAVVGDIISTFDAGIAKFYDETALAAKYVETLSREGKKRKFPLVTVSIGIITNERRIFSHYGEVVEKATEMKNYAKSFTTGESRYVKDKRCLTY